MFGYVRIQKDDLKIRNYNIYRNKYCGLCQILGKKYGKIYRLIISYDVTFLILLLENFEKEDLDLSFRCSMNPLKRIDVNVSEQVTEYAAFINYYLAVLKLEDDVMDEKSILKKIILKLFKHNSYYKKMMEIYGEEITILSKMMNTVNELEKTNTSFDILSNSFGNFFAEIFKIYFRFYKKDNVEIMKDNVFSLCFNLGKWIYIMDAYDDYSEDIKYGKFNLLRNIMNEDDSSYKLRAHKKISTINRILILKMKESFNKITWNKNGEIIYNIISCGCIDTYLKILHRRYSEIESDLRTNYEGEN